ncbi:hypothetical protein Lepto7376_0822 [[Leptolyngbya] sp. PCC 7376]|uniref:hypothetical protein n=1 Tax=[Leptolyngbya] sp. PCC 7376 TaxID=111781 RepID=UPI00029F2022|nr:hypothetical protein [[Leptolyngbya] sp. PCC 7376]AFY37218.1 hypothetical protein Lepto7376_0822 [[Leptolyngbya] sp. PCC 7376]
MRQSSNQQGLHFSARLLLCALSGGVLWGSYQPVIFAAIANQSDSRETELDTMIAQVPTVTVAESSDNDASETADVTSNTEAIAEEQIKILTPTSDKPLESISSSVIVEHRGSGVVTLTVNDIPVDNELIGRTNVDNGAGLTNTTWYGVIFPPGENTLTATVEIDGVIHSTAAKVIAPGLPTEMRLRTKENSIIADGRSTATIVGSFYDEQGTASTWNTTVSLFSSDGEFVGVDLDADQPGFQVKSTDGKFTAQLQSTTEPETLILNASAGELTAYTQLLQKPQLREVPLISGYFDLRYGARGTDFFDRFKYFLPIDGDNDHEFDVDSAVFATGSIGEWKFTGAYNSDRPINEDCDCSNRLFGDYQSSEYTYPVYGTSSSREATTPSIDQVYLRFERASSVENANPDFIMWGDYNVREFSTESQEFSATNRDLHGLKAHYNLGDLELTAFHSNSVEGFQRDVIVPDGTSGYYFVSRRLLVAGSEDIYLESEEFNRPGIVTRREKLQRGRDYEIDYDRGSILFSDPIYTTDANEFGEVLVNRIVATYQYEDASSSDTSVYGGRVRYHFDRDFQSESWLGASYVKEDRDLYDFELFGVDSKLSFGDHTTVLAEFAHSKNFSAFQGDVEGSAYRIEVDTKIGDWLTANAYYRNVDPGFANNATLSFVPGQTRYGLKTTARLSPTTNFNFKYDHEDNFGTPPRPLDDFEELINPGFEPVPGFTVDNSLTTITAGIEQRIGKAQVALDWVSRDRSDRRAPNVLESNSQVLRSRLTLPLTDRITVRAQNELGLSSSADSVTGDRTLLGIEYRLTDWLNLNYSTSWFTRGPQSGKSITSVGLNADYALGTDTTINAKYNINGGVDGMTGIGTLGLQQKWHVLSGLRLDFGYQYTFQNFGRTGNDLQFRQPFAVGQGASSLGLDGQTSFNVGFEYTDDANFKVSGRWERRNSTQGGNTVINLDAAGKVTPSLTALFSYNYAQTANQTFDEELGGTSNLRLGLAYRDPESDNFNALFRFEHRQNPSVIPDTILFGSGTGSEETVFALEAIYAPNWQWEFYGKYAFRNSTTFLADDFVADSSVHLGQLRARYRLGYQWDVAVEGRWIGQASANFSEMGFMLETGYYFTPDLRVYTGYSFGRVDDYDFNGAREAGGVYAGVNVKLDGLFRGWLLPDDRE